jgi:hypothetical protein
MILDKKMELASALAVTGADAYTTYALDLGNPTVKNDIAAGEPMAMVFCVDTAAAGSTDTSDFSVVQCAAAAFSSGQEKLATRRIANADLTAGSIHVIPIPSHPDPLRYLAGQIELGSGDTVTVSVYVVPLSFVDKIRQYAPGFSIS